MFAKRKAQSESFKGIPSTALFILVALFIMLFDNRFLFSNLLEREPLHFKYALYLGALFLMNMLLLFILFSVLCIKRATKPVLIFMLMFAALLSYFMNTYHLIIDSNLIQSSFQTNLTEIKEWFHFKLGFNLFVLGILPSFLIYKVKLRPSPLKAELYSRMKLVLTSLVIFTLLFFSLSSFHPSFPRDHKLLRYHLNPVYGFFSLAYSSRDLLHAAFTSLKPIGRDAKLIHPEQQKLVIMVVGESARADHFSLNGYERETNPLLSRERIINFMNLYTCGISSTSSVACMFSQLGLRNFNNRKANGQENLLDVLQHAGAKVLWRDNNSGSNRVADRVAYQDFHTAASNPDCDEECRDEGMLADLQDYIDGQKGTIFIVLHQKGNQGPAYYKRYPKNFERYTPVCQTNQLNQCSEEEIGNAYDNAILYTDYFLARVIDLLKQNQDNYQTAMLYFSDHGESLGENDLYLHGLPYHHASEPQKHIPAIIWLGENFAIDRQVLESKVTNPYTQSNLFHTVLGMIGVETSAYEATQDMLGHD